MIDISFETAKNDLILCGHYDIVYIEIALYQPLQVLMIREKCLNATTFPL